PSSRCLRSPSSARRGRNTAEVRWGCASCPAPAARRVRPPPWPRPSPWSTSTGPAGTKGWSSSKPPLGSEHYSCYDAKPLPILGFRKWRREGRIAPPLPWGICALLLRGELDRRLGVVRLRLERGLGARHLHRDHAAVLGRHRDPVDVLRVPGGAGVVLALDVHRDLEPLAVERAGLHFLLLVRLLDLGLLAARRSVHLRRLLDLDPGPL